MRARVHNTQHIISKTMDAVHIPSLYGLTFTDLTSNAGVAIEFDEDTRYATHPWTCPDVEPGRLQLHEPSKPGSGANIYTYASTQGTEVLEWGRGSEFARIKHKGQTQCIPFLEVNLTCVLLSFDPGDYSLPSSSEDTAIRQGGWKLGGQPCMRPYRNDRMLIGYRRATRWGSRLCVISKERC